MRIESEIKLDYKDVLLRPKRSTLTSRREIELTREFKFKHSRHCWSGVPIVAANMFHTGTFSMLPSFSDYKMLVCLSKHYSNEENFSDKDFLSFSISTGILEADWDKMFAILTLNSQIRFICVDVANGYTQRFVDFVKRVRRSFPNKVIIAGNVVSGEMTEELILSGADIVKVGIGGGCFSSGTQIRTRNGDKNIEDIRIGEEVLTHKGEYQKVTNTFSKTEDSELIKINDIECTKNHEFYVLNKRHEAKVNDENIHDYAEWIAAENLNEDYYLLELESLIMLKKIKLKKINSIERKKFSGTVFDLEVLGNHSYVANGVIVHNSVCTTRIQTGVGYPQLSAVIECADAAHGVGGHIMADGGCVCVGDISKAFCAGADFVMLGGMLAGHTESAGDEEIINGEKYKLFYGMSSETAMNNHNGGMASYRASEGKTIKLKHRGSVKGTIENILGGIRSTCTYIGAKSLKDMPKCTTFIRVTQQSNEIFGRNT